MPIIIECSSVQPLFEGAVPALELKFRVSNRGGLPFKIIRFAYTIRFTTVGRTFLGSGNAVPYHGGESAGWLSSDTTITSPFELGYEKASVVDQAIYRTSPDNDLSLQIDVQCDLMEQVGSKEGWDLVKHWSYGGTCYSVITRGHWDRWMSQWGRLRRVITVSGTLAHRLDEIKKEAGALSYEDLIGTLVDNYLPLKGAIETVFVSTMPDRKEIRTKLEEILSKAGDAKEVLLTGWVDGSVIGQLRQLLGKGVEVRLLARKSTEKGVRDAIEQLKAAGANVKIHNMNHARILVVGEREALISSADPKASSLVDNREAGVYSRNPTVVRAARNFFEEVWNEPLQPSKELVPIQQTND